MASLAAAGQVSIPASGVAYRKNALSASASASLYGGARPALPSLAKSSRAYSRVAVKAALADRPASQPRFIQHKQEAFWFYRFLSIVYDHVINPGHWTEDMREDALEPADLNDRNLKVVDVGGGTGFTTLGVVKHVDAKNVTILDQSPHQLAKAKQKEPLKACTILEGDAEDLPFPTDYADRYVSAGRYARVYRMSIESPCIYEPDGEISYHPHSFTKRKFQPRGDVP